MKDRFSSQLVPIHRSVGTYLHQERGRGGEVEGGRGRDGPHVAMFEKVKAKNKHRYNTRKEYVIPRVAFLNNPSLILLQVTE